MEIPRVSSSVRRITVFRKDTSGDVKPVTVYRRRDKKKKTSAILRPFERVARRVADAQAKSSQSYLSRHDRSNQKKKDGWVQDIGPNVFRASQKGVKALKLDRLFSF
jgi:hypothetical protein